MHTPRWKTIADAIHAEINDGVLASGASLPSETDLAEKWGVSRMTAHRAMHELHTKGIVVRKRRAGSVVAPVEERQKTGHVAVFVQFRDSLEQEYLAGIRAGLPEEYDLLFCNIDFDPNREASYLEKMRQRTDGIICIPTCAQQNNHLLSSTSKTGAPVICVDCIPEGAEVDAIISDNYGATLDAVRFLTQRGHQRIAYFTDSQRPLSSLRERAAGYYRALEEIGVTNTQRWQRHFPFEVQADSVVLKQAVQDSLFALLHQPEPPTAIFCVHDYMLAAVIQACRELEISIPSDLEVLSFNDCPPIVPFLPGNIHRIVQGAYEIGRVASERLCQRMRGEEMTPEIVRIAPRFYPAEAPVSSS